MTSHHKGADYHIPLAERVQIENKRQMRKLLIAIMPCVLVAIYLVWRRFG